MRAITTLISVPVLILSFLSFGQTKVVIGYEPIREDLKSWDAIRGPWLANSIEAIANDQPIPPRTFPENFTPNQMLRMVDPNTRDNIRTIVNENRMNEQNAEFWNRVNRTVESAYCSPMQARTYGDPHLVSFDGARYSFQTVGEFVLTKSSRGDVEVQTRQKPQTDEFSLNTAVAMNVAGDRLAIYADDYPDADYSTPVRLNGRSLQLTGATYFLDHGGTIQKSGQSYFIHWPNGESAEVQMRSSGRMPFVDVSVNVFPCATSSYSGLLGNANGDERDDFDPGFIIPYTAQRDPFDDDNYVNKERQAYIAKVLADKYRVDDFTTLFDYPIGRNTASFTDRSFPRVFRTIDDLDARSRDRARQRCEQTGISARDMNGCIFDNGFLNLEPVKEPRVNDPVAATPTLRKIDREVINRNPPKPVTPIIPSSIDKGSATVGSDTKSPSNGNNPTPVANPRDEEIKKAEDLDNTKTPSTVTPTTRTNTTPIDKTPSTVTPTTRTNTTPTDKTPSTVTPTPRPTPAPRAEPKPTFKSPEPTRSEPRPLPTRDVPSSTPSSQPSSNPSSTPRPSSGTINRGRGGF